MDERSEGDFYEKALIRSRSIVEYYEFNVHGTMVRLVIVTNYEFPWKPDDRTLYVSPEVLIVI